MLERTIGDMVVNARIVRTGISYEIMLLTRPVGATSEAMAFELPNKRKYSSVEDAEKDARVVLLGVTGIDAKGKPVLSVC